jgi:hypothetical protein
VPPLQSEAGLAHGNDAAETLGDSVYGEDGAVGQGGFAPMRLSQSRHGECQIRDGQGI